MLDVAETLFLREGVRATGVDTVSAQAGVAKTTLYRHFPSKDDLVRAYLERRDGVHFAWLGTAVPGRENDPAAQLHAEIDLIAAAVTSPGFPGCPFLNAASEFGDRAHPARTGAADHKGRVLTHLTDLVTRTGARRPQELARALSLLTDGAYEAGRILGPDGPAAAYGPAAHALVDRYLPGPPSTQDGEVTAPEAMITEGPVARPGPRGGDAG